MSAGPGPLNVDLRDDRVVVTITRPALRNAIDQATVDGPALGGGAELAYACDVQIASTQATFGNPEPGLGILAAAGAALRLGLVMEVTAPDELIGRAHAVLDRICAQSALALRITKLVTDAGGPHPVADDLAQAILFETQDKDERMTAFLERRK